MKTKEELAALKEEVKSMNEKLSALTDEELAQVTGGMKQWLLPDEFPIEDFIVPTEKAVKIPTAYIIVNGE